MLYLHRANIESRYLGRLIPITLDYMGSSEFEQGGAANTFRMLSSTSKLAIGHMQVKTYEYGKLGDPKRWFTQDIYLLGQEHNIREVAVSLAKYHNPKLAERNSKEIIEFGRAPNKYGQHQLGIEINHFVVASVLKGFTEFLHYLCITGTLRDLRTSSTYRMGDKVYFYDQHNDCVRKGKIKGIPENEMYLTVQPEGSKKKKQIQANFVVPEEYIGPKVSDIAEPYEIDTKSDA